MSNQLGIILIEAKLLNTNCTLSSLYIYMVVKRRNVCENKVFNIVNEELNVYIHIYIFENLYPEQ